MNAEKINLGKVSITVEKDYWDITKDYDRLVIVERAADSTVYLSRKFVPAGTSINDREYWIKFGIFEQSIYQVVNQLGNDPEAGIAQQVVTRNIRDIRNEIFESLTTIERAIGLLSPNQQEALSIAQEVVRLRNQIKQYSIVCLSQEEYDALVADENINENTLYFIEEEDEE